MQSHSEELARKSSQGKQTDLILLLPKAFDEVNHSKLALKLHSYDIKGSILRWIQAFLSNRRQRVVVEHSDPVLVTTGVLQQRISKPEFYGDLVYRNRTIVGKFNFAVQFKKCINRYKRIVYNPYIMRQTVCLVVNPITVDSYALLFNCTTVVRASDSMTASS